MRHTQLVNQWLGAVFVAVLGFVASVMLLNIASENVIAFDATVAQEALQKLGK